MDQLTSQKKRLRETLQKKRAGLSPDHQRSAAREVSQIALPFLSSEKKKIISIYSPKGAELDPQLLGARLTDGGHVLCLPVVEPDSKIMTFRIYQFGDRLEKGAFDILEPLAERAIIVPEIVFCPLLAADLDGNRLGYGGGYFDQTLRALQKQGEVLAVGLCYDAQIIEQVPVDENDIRLNYLLSEKRCVQC